MEKESADRFEKARFAALKILSQVENPFLRDAFLGIFDVQRSTPNAHAEGLLLACALNQKNPTDFITEWKNDKKAREIFLRALNIAHQSTGANRVNTEMELNLLVKGVADLAISLQGETGLLTEFVTSFNAHNKFDCAILSMKVLNLFKRR